MRSELHRAARLEIIRIAQHPLIIRCQEPPGLAREALGRGVAPRGHVAFHGVRNRVVAGDCGHLARLRPRQQRIENGHAKRRLGIAAGHFHVRPSIGNQRVALRLAASAGRGRNCDHRQHRSRGLAVAPVIAHAAAVGVYEVDSFGAVERAAAPEPDDGVHAASGREHSPGLDHHRVRIWFEVVERESLHAGFGQPLDGARHIARRHQAAVRDHQRAPEAQLAGQRAQLFESAFAEQDPGADLEVEWPHG